MYVPSTRDARAGQTGRSPAPLRTHTFPPHEPTTLVLLFRSTGTPLVVTFSLSFPTNQIKPSLFLFFHLNAPCLLSALLGEYTLPRGIPGITLALCFPGETSPCSCRAFADDAEPHHLTLSLLVHMSGDDLGCHCLHRHLPLLARAFPHRQLSHTVLWSNFPPGLCR